MSRLSPRLVIILLTMFGLLFCGGQAMALPDVDSQTLSYPARGLEGSAAVPESSQGGQV